MTDERLNALLPLAAKIAREFSNIPGLPHPEIEIVTHEACVRTAQVFDLVKGDFITFAAAAIRIALRVRHECQTRILLHHLYDLDLFATSADTQATPSRGPELQASMQPV